MRRSLKNEAFFVFEHTETGKRKDRMVTVRKTTKRTMAAKGYFLYRLVLVVVRIPTITAGSSSYFDNNRKST
jgi:hypothetical protein